VNVPVYERLVNEAVAKETVPAKVADWSAPRVNAVVGVAPVLKTSAPVVSAVYCRAVVVRVDALMVLMATPCYYELITTGSTSTALVKDSLSILINASLPTLSWSRLNLAELILRSKSATWLVSVFCSSVMSS